MKIGSRAVMTAKPPADGDLTKMACQSCMYLCDNLTCKQYEEIRQQYMIYSAVDAIFLSARAGLLVFLFAWDRHAKAPSTA